ncbi:hypothetical protein JZU54_02870, partial [bacterium]|nr:hypothetical protein [bacterium]
MAESLRSQNALLEHEVAQRTAELVVARDEAEKRREVAEAALAESIRLKGQLEAERAYLQEEIRLEKNHQNIIGQSESLKYVLYKV